MLDTSETSDEKSGEPAAEAIDSLFDAVKYVFSGVTVVDKCRMLQVSSQTANAGTRMMQHQTPADELTSQGNFATQYL